MSTRQDIETEERPKSVEFYAAPWVSGATLHHRLGSISSEQFAPDFHKNRTRAWRKAQRIFYDELATKARALHANAVVTLELTFDPFASGLVDGVRESGVRLFAEGVAVIVEFHDR